MQIASDVALHIGEIAIHRIAASLLRSNLYARRSSGVAAILLS
jgi:hypothetical protein